MKFSTIASTVFGAAILFASKVVADVDYFDYPFPGTSFCPGSSIPFFVDDMPDGDDHERVYANLYTANGRFVKTIRSWYNMDCDDDEFYFSWTVDQTTSSGRYFVEICSEDDDDDVARSFVFEISDSCSTSGGRNGGGRNGGDRNGGSRNGGSRNGGSRNRGGRGDRRSRNRLNFE